MEINFRNMLELKHQGRSTLGVWLSDKLSVRSTICTQKMPSSSPLNMRAFNMQASIFCLRGGISWQKAQRKHLLLHH